MIYGRWSAALIWRRGTSDETYSRPTRGTPDVQLDYIVDFLCSATDSELELYAGTRLQFVLGA